MAVVDRRGELAGLRFTAGALGPVALAHEQHPGEHGDDERPRRARPATSAAGGCSAPCRRRGAGRPPARGRPRPRWRRGRRARRRRDRRHGSPPSRAPTRPRAAVELRRVLARRRPRPGRVARSGRAADCPGRPRPSTPAAAATPVSSASWATSTRVAVDHQRGGGRRARRARRRASSSVAERGRAAAAGARSSAASGAAQSAAAAGGRRALRPVERAYASSARSARAPFTPPAAA